MLRRLAVSARRNNAAAASLEERVCRLEAASQLQESLWRKALEELLGSQQPGEHVEYSWPSVGAAEDHQAGSPQRLSPEAVASELSLRLAAALSFKPEELRKEVMEEVAAARARLRGELDGLAGILTAQRAVAAASIRQELEALRRDLLEARDTSRAAAEVLTAQAVEVERLRGALAGDCDRLLRFVSEERAREGNLRVCGERVEWVVQNLGSWQSSLQRGQALESPTFAVDVPGVGHLTDLRLRFFPRGGRSATRSEYCSLYLLHPRDLPWVQYELGVGSCTRGTFDPLFEGTDDFCDLAAEVSKGSAGEPDTLVLSVRFLLPAAERRAGRCLTPKGALPSVGYPAVAAGGLWLSTNRLDA